MRIVAMSDLHGHLPDVPPCDLLIIAGDICPDRVGSAIARDRPEAQKAWFDRTCRPWLAGIEARHTLLTWGNHDYCGEVCRFDDLSDGAAGAPRIVVDAPAAIPRDGGGRPLSVWATPWSNQFMHWAFMKPREALAGVYAAIPEGIDILVSHQPPFGHGDRFEHARTGAVEHLGSRELLAAIERVTPRLVVCGHMHAGHGRYAVGGTEIYNVSLVNDQYKLVHSPTVIDLDDW